VRNTGVLRFAQNDGNWFLGAPVVTETKTLRHKGRRVFSIHFFNHSRLSGVDTPIIFGV
jgi:hypothetical protein